MNGSSNRHSAHDFGTHRHAGHLTPIILNLKPGKNLGPHTNPKPGFETWVRGGLTIHRMSIGLIASPSIWQKPGFGEPNLKIGILHPWGRKPRKGRFSNPGFSQVQDNGCNRPCRRSLAVPQEVSIPSSQCTIFK